MDFTAVLKKWEKPVLEELLLRTTTGGGTNSYEDPAGLFS